MLSSRQKRTATAQATDKPAKKAPSRRRAEAPLQGRSEATRDKLLAAATAGFAREGYDGYSSRMISSDSEIHHALIAYHFGGKLGLWKACLMRIIEDLRAHLAVRQAEAADDVGRLRIMVEEFIRFNARNPAFQALMIDAIGRSDGRFEWVMTTLGGTARETWTRLIASAQASGHFVEGDPAMLLDVFQGAAIRVYVMAGEAEFNGGRSPFDPEFIDEHVQTCLRLFFRD
jgi:AcrR family transcriptional regulator